MKSRRFIARGFTLVEVALSLGIAAFVLVAIFALLPLGLTSNANSIEQTAAANIATSIVADLRATPLGSGTMAVEGKTPRFELPVPVRAADGTPMASGTGVTLISTFMFFAEDGTGRIVSGSTADVESADRYRTVVTLGVPGAGQRAATSVAIRVTWPAAATGRPQGAFDAVTAIDRN